MNAPVDPFRPCDPFPPPDQSVAIVGNAPVTEAAAAIDAAACVIRFNNAAGFDGPAGCRVTHLALVNRGGQMRAWLDDPHFLDRPVVQRTHAFILPFPMLPAEENGPAPVCWTREALALLIPLGKSVHILSDAVHRAAWRRLASPSAGRPNPSTGLLVTLGLLLDRPPRSGPVDVFGFGFAGWPGHPWAAERRWFAQAEATGHLRLHPEQSGQEILRP